MTDKASKARRSRADSLAAAVRVASAAMVEVKPPSHIELLPSDMPFWRAVVAEFPKVEWTEHQLEVAAHLAKAMADLEGQRAKLRVEEYVITVKEGKSFTNPRHGVARDLTNSVMSLRRNLSLHARAKGGEARNLGERRAGERDIERAVAGDDYDGLLQ